MRKYLFDMREILLKIRKYSQNGGQTMRFDGKEGGPPGHFLLCLNCVQILFKFLFYLLKNVWVTPVYDLSKH